MVKKVLFITQQPPYGTALSQEKLQMAMVFGAFELNVSMLFINDGVFSIVKNQQPEAIGFVNFSKQYSALGKYYDIKQIYVDQHSLKQRALVQDNLLIPVTVLDQGALTRLMHEQDFIINN